MMDVTVKMDKVSMKPIKVAHTRYAVMSLNKAGRKGTTDIWRRIKERYTAKRKDVMSKKNVRPIKATRTHMRAGMRWYGHGLSLDQFKTSYPVSRSAQRSKAGVGVEIIRGRRKVIPGSFKATVKGRLRVAKRRGPERLPIKVLVGPTARMMAGKFALEVQLFMYRYFNKEYIRLMNTVKPKVTRR